jgi:hypothetical protein
MFSRSTTFAAARAAQCQRASAVHRGRRLFSADGRSSWHTSWNKSTITNKAGVIFAGIAATGVAVGGLKVAIDLYTGTLSYAKRRAVDAMMQPFQLDDIATKLERKAPSTLWVDRTAVLKWLKSLQSTSSTDGKYCLLIGEKGTGKSFVSYKSVLNRPGVVYLLISASTAAKDVNEKLLEATGFDVKLHPTTDPLSRLKELLHSVQKRLAADSVWPVVLIEIERNTDSHIVDTVCRTLKELSAVCRGFAVVTEATAAMALSPDSGRRLEIWVPDFSEVEARQYLNKANTWREDKGLAALSEDDINNAIAEVGTRPSTLHDLMTSPLTQVDFVTNCIEVEKRRIHDLLRVDRKYARIIFKLFEQDTVNHDELTSILNAPIKKIAEVAMSEHHVLSYNPVTGRAQFHSAAMQEAAKQWAEEEAKKYFWQR